MKPCDKLVFCSLSLFALTARAAVPFPPPECPNTKPDPATQAFCGGTNSPCELITQQLFCTGNKITREEVYSGCVANDDTECKQVEVPCYSEWVCLWYNDDDPTTSSYCKSSILVTTATDFKKILVACESDPPP